VNDLLRDRITAVWAVLMAATLVSWLLGTGHRIGATGAGIIILLVAFVKVRFVGRTFMELRRAPVPLLMLFEVWVVVVCVVAIGLFVFM
jgi:hypothetical protein